MASSRELVATFEGERRVFINDAGMTRVIIGEVRDTDGQVRCIKGEANEGRLKPGLVYRWWGHTTHHHKYGEQFVFSSFCLVEPKGQHATCVYLQQCDGIGPAKARALWEAYGEDAIEMLRTKPAECIKVVKGLKLDTAEDAAELLRDMAKTERSMVDILGLLHARGMPKKLPDDLMERYGIAAAETIRRNPYLLMQFRGIGFLKADKLYLELKHDPARLKRQALCAWHAIASNNSGDTWLRRQVAERAIHANISGSSVDPDRAIKLALRANLLTERTDSLGCRWLAEFHKAKDEARICQFISDALAESAEGDYASWPDAADLDISPHQQEQAGRAMAGRIGILAGRPGTGKTYTVAAIIKELSRRLGGTSSIAACAPTGKAAVRFTEALGLAGVNITATTTHSLLRVSSSDNGRFSFEYNERYPLQKLFIFVDETSMKDAWLMAALLAARGKGTSILFVGDINQLAPVGHGAPLRDMIAAGVPCGELTEIRRNAGQIVATCKEIVERKRLIVSQRINADAGDNLAIVEKETPREQIQILTKCVEKLREDPEQKVDPVWGVQVIVAVNKKSELGRKPLNRILQNLLNPETDENSVEGCPFRVGDKIICTKNSRFPNAELAQQKPRRREDYEDSDDRDQPKENTELYVANGEQAEVITVEPRRLIARLTAPDRLIIIPRGQQADDQDETGSTDDANDDSTGTGCNWELAYAISCHRSQGSEWPVVIVMIDEHSGAQRVCTRNWIYTAISRAKKWCLLIGKKQIAEQMLTRDGIKNRKTFLQELLTDAIAGTKRAGEQTNASRFDVDWLDVILDELIDSADAIEELIEI